MKALCPAYLLMILLAGCDPSTSTASPPSQGSIRKARIDPLEKVPSEARVETKRGCVFVRYGKYWRDISKVIVDLDRKDIFYDCYHFERRPDQGHIDLTQEQSALIGQWCSELWMSSKDNAEDPAHTDLVVGIEELTTLVLWDGKDPRVFSSSTKPLPAWEKLHSLVWDLVMEKTTK